MSVSRRDFLAATAATGAALAAPAVHGAEKNKKYRTALVGSGWWGMNIFRTGIQSGDVRAVAMCDVDRNQLDPAAAEVERLTGTAPKKYRDYRELLAKEKPEICVVATPDHWHPLVTIAACKAGAHVYVEKPISHTILEGRAMVQAARNNDRVVQIGTHRRASPHNISAMKFLQQGKLGKIGMVRAFVHYGGGPEKPQSNEEPPQGLDWNMWCGPAPLRAFNRKIHSKGFRQFLDYANGTLGDWGIHWMDQILWWTEEQWPTRVSSIGGRPIAGPLINDGNVQTTDAPDHQVALFEFDSFSVSWEHRRFAGNHAEKHNIGCYFYGTAGTLHLGWLDGWTFYPLAKRGEPALNVKPQLHTKDSHNIPELWANFVRCVRTGRRPICDIEIGHRSTSMSLLGMLSLKIGRGLRWDGAKEQIVGDPQANRLLRRDYRGPWKYPEIS